LRSAHAALYGNTFSVQKKRGVLKNPRRAWRLMRLVRRAAGMKRHTL
jgi:hypothetical protein